MYSPRNAFQRHKSLTKWKGSVEIVIKAWLIRKLISWINEKNVHLNVLKILMVKLNYYNTCSSSSYKFSKSPIEYKCFGVAPAMAIISPMALNLKSQVQNERGNMTSVAYLHEIRRWPHPWTQYDCFCNAGHIEYDPTRGELCLGLRNWSPGYTCGYGSP